MEVYLLRHGIAVDRGVHNLRNDSVRPLTAEGVRKTEKIGSALARLKFKFDAVFCSPYVRAKQTADIVVDALKVHQKLRLCAPLAPGGKPRDLVAEIRRQCQTDSKVMLIGHEPGLSRLASLWITGRADANLTLKKAGLCVLDTTELVTGRCASLQLLLTPKVLLRLA